MIGYRQTLLALLLAMACGAAVAQNNTNSPYTRYGYGQIADYGSGNSRAMGGIGYAIRDKYQVNTANPASYSAVDSLTFIFDGGFSLQNTNFSNGTVKMNVKNSSFDYITMLFRAAPWAGISAGMIPYSNVGYNVADFHPATDGSPTHTVSYYGEGGLHQVYLGAGFKILKNLSVGANISYLWGDISRSRQETFPTDASSFSFVEQTDVSMRSYKLDFGVQYTQQFGKKHSATLGAFFSPGHDLNNSATVTSQTSTTVSRDTVATFGIPTTLGVGVTYQYDNRLTVGLDYTLQKWSDVTYMNQKDAFCDRTKLSLGAEYVPNPMGRNYLSLVKYRLGAFYSQPYYKVDGKRAADEFGITGGFGLPIPRTRSVLSLSAQYVHTKGKYAGFLDENTLRICIGVTFNEGWFFKRQVD